MERAQLCSPPSSCGQQNSAPYSCRAPVFHLPWAGPVKPFSAALLSSEGFTWLSQAHTGSFPFDELRGSRWVIRSWGWCSIILTGLATVIRGGVVYMSVSYWLLRILLPYPWFFKLFSEEWNTQTWLIPGNEAVFWPPFYEQVKLKTHEKLTDLKDQTKTLWVRISILSCFFINSYKFASELFFNSSHWDHSFETSEQTSPGKLCQKWWVSS